MANNSYNPFKDIDSIYDSKKKWKEANAAGNTALADEISRKAYSNYYSLEQNGYKNVADELRNVDDEGAVPIRNFWGKKGNVKIRDYVPAALAKYNINPVDIQNDITYDNDTGNVTLGGMNLGQPVANIDGRTYWKSEDLDPKIQQYIKNKGITMTDEAAYNTGRDTGYSYLSGIMSDQKTKSDEMYKSRMSAADASQKAQEEYRNKIYSTIDNVLNPDNELYKKILSYYGQQGDFAGKNAAANVAGSNGGNIDSYAAANANRQNLAFQNAGANAVMNDMNSRISMALNAAGLLGNQNNDFNTVYSNTMQGLNSDMVNNWTSMQNTAAMHNDLVQNTFNNNETVKNNWIDRNNKIIDYTGVIPDSYMAKINPYLNDDGSIKAEYADYNDDKGGFTADWNELKARYDKATDRIEKNNLMQQMNMLAQAHNAKIANNPTKYSGVERLAYFNNASMPKYQTDVGYATTNNSLASTERQTADTNAATLEQQKLINAGNLAKQQSINATNQAINSANLAAAEKSQDKQIDLTKWGVQNGVTIDNEGNVKQPSAAEVKAEEEEQKKIEAAAEEYKAKGEAIISDLNDVYDKSSESVQKYIRLVLEPMIKGETTDEQSIKNNLIANAGKYDLEVEDLKAICEALDIDKKWVDDYKNKGWFGWSNGVEQKS